MLPFFPANAAVGAADAYPRETYTKFSVSCRRRLIIDVTRKEFFSAAERAAPTRDLDASIVVEVAAVKRSERDQRDLVVVGIKKVGDVCRLPTAKSDPDVLSYDISAAQFSYFGFSFNSKYMETI